MAGHRCKVVEDVCAALVTVDLGTMRGKKLVVAVDDGSGGIPQTPSRALHFWLR